MSYKQLLEYKIQLLFGMAAAAPSPNLEASPRPRGKEGGEHSVFNYFPQSSVVRLCLNLDEWFEIVSFHGLCTYHWTGSGVSGSVLEVVGLLR